MLYASLATLAALAGLSAGLYTFARRHAFVQGGSKGGGRGGGKEKSEQSGTSRRDAYSFPAASLTMGGMVAIVSFLVLSLFQSMFSSMFSPMFLRLGAPSPFVLLGLCALLASCSVFAFVRFAPPTFPARAFVETILRILLFLSSTLAIATTLAIVASLLFETLRFFEEVPLTDFLFGLHWSPQTALFDEDIGASGAFGALPVVLGTLLITVIALLVAVPVGLFSAIYLVEFASQRTRAFVKPTLEVLSGIPTVVYGFFAALVLAPKVRSLGESLGLNVASESALAAGLVMGVMLIPFVSSLSDDALAAVPQDLRHASLALGATRSETIAKAVLPAALPGVAAGVLLAFSRAVGETMIVVMAAGLAAKLTINPLDAPTTITVQIVTLLTGDQEFDSSKTLSAFALGMLLFCLTLVINATALLATRRYGARYV